MSFFDTRHVDTNFFTVKIFNFGAILANNRNRSIDSLFIVVEHLLSAFELSKIDNIEDNLSPCYSDRNIPPFNVRLPDILYLLLYGRIPPKSKYANASENQQNILIQWDMMRIILNSSESLFNMK